MTESEKPMRKKSWMLRLALLAVMLIFAFFALSIVPGGRIMLLASKQRTISMMQALEIAYQGYIEDSGSLPKSLDNHSFFMALSGAQNGKKYMMFKPNQTNTSGELVDAWGTPFRITYFSETDVRIISAGPDKIFGTADDITNQR